MNTKTKLAIGIVVALIALILIVNKGFGVHVFTVQNSTTTAGNLDGTANGAPAVKNPNTPNTNGDFAKPLANGLSDSALAQILLNTKIRVPQTGVDVALTGGQADFVDSSTKGHVVNGRVLGKIATDAGHDVFTDMTVTIAGQPGVLHYVAIFHNEGQTVTYTSAVLIGDRVNVVGVVANVPPSAIQKPLSYMKSAVSYNLTVNYLDRKNAEPFTVAPSLAKTVTLRVAKHIVSK
jgi:hypothetical protein